MFFNLVSQQFATMLMSDAKNYQQTHVIDIGILSARPPTMFPLLRLCLFSSVPHPIRRRNG